MPEVVISDSSCLIALSNAGHLDLLKQVYGKITTTPRVVEEFGLPVPSWVTVRSPLDTALIKRFLEVVDAGEASAIALAVEMKGSLLILDDWAARRLASDLQLLHTGTIGVLLRAKAMGLVPAVAPILDDLQRVNFRMSTEVVNYALRLAGEA